jgi:uncharacterized membrane protein
VLIAWFRVLWWFVRRQLEVNRIANAVARKQKQQTPQPVQIDPAAQALEILNERLARGEISEAEYQRLRATIESHPAQPPGAKRRL